jgi:hypothetical protein
MPQIQDKDRDATIDWLDRNGFKYHNLITDKPRGGNYFFVDNLPLKFHLFEGNYNNIE